MTPVHDDARALRRLLQALDEHGASASRDEIGGDAALIVRATRNGVTLLCTRAPASVGETAARAGLAQWVREGARKHLRITAAGRAWLRRENAPRAADPFQAQHADYESRPPEKGAAPVLMNEAESPLAWLARRKDRDGRRFLDPAQIEAGERLRRDLEQAQLLQRVTANWEAAISASRRADAGAAVSEVAMDARRRLDGAFDAVGREMAGLLIDICGYLKGLETVESERGWPARSGKVVLRIALERLARHYGIGVAAQGPSRAKGVRHWGAEDYRPEM